MPWFAWLLAESLFRPLARQGLPDNRKQLPTVPGLGQEISNSYRPKFLRAHLKYGRAGEHDRQSRIDFQEFCRQLDSIEAWHLQVRDDQIDPLRILLKQRQRLARILTCLDLIAARSENFTSESKPSQ